MEKGCVWVNELSNGGRFWRGKSFAGTLASSQCCGKIFRVMPHGGCQDTVNLEPDTLAPTRKGKTMGDLSTIADMLKDFGKFGKNFVELFRGIPDILIRFGSLGTAAKELPNDTASK